jgi:hypothetical protein
MPTELPTNWITAQSLATFGGMVAAVFVVMLTIDILGVPQDYQRVLGLSAALILNIVLAVFQPLVFGIDIVIAIVNGFLTFLAALLGFILAAPLRDKYRKTT